MPDIDPCIWPRVPGYDSDSSDDEAEFIPDVTKRLDLVRQVLAHRWVDPQLLKFAPVARRSGGVATPVKKYIPRSGGAALSTPPKFRLETHSTAAILRETFLANGLSQTDGQEHCIQWSGPGMSDSAYMGLHEHQRVNHFPGSTELTRKDRMAVHLSGMAEAFGSDCFDFIPETYVLPSQVGEFLETYEKKPGSLWIVKPNNACCGRGVFLLRDISDLPLSELSVVSRYVEDPLLIQGLKFDLRIYVVVTQYDPLRAYVYREGLARFASAPYSTDVEHLQDAYRHLTNYSVNKKSPMFMENKEVNADNVGHKWSLSALNKHLKYMGVDAKLMWSRIMDLVVKTLFAVEPHIGSRAREATVHNGVCFELYGFDVLVDSQLKPWILEVNLSPSMQADSPLDWQVKSALLSDTFNLVGVCHADWSMVAKSKAHGDAIRKARSQKQLIKTRSESSFSGLGAVASAAAANARVNRANTVSGADSMKAGVDAAAVVLDKLNETQLKVLARSLQEGTRHENFIPLYPTRAAVEHYRYITEVSGPKARKIGALRYAAKLIPKQMVASVLFGPLPTCSGASRLNRTMSVSSISAETRRLRQSGQSNRAEAVFNSGQDDLEDDGEDETSPMEASMTEDPAESPEQHKVDRASAIEALRSLEAGLCRQILMLEYLVRIVNACESLSGAERASLAQSAAYSRLYNFQKGLQAAKQLIVSNYDSSGESDSDGGGIVDDIASACKQSLNSFFKVQWAQEGLQACRPKNLVCKHRGALAEQLPPRLVQRAGSTRTFELLSTLGCNDLEALLLDPTNPPGFRKAMEPLVTREAPTGTARVSSSNRKRRPPRPLVPCTPLGELLRARSRRSQSGAGSHRSANSNSFLTSLVDNSDANQSTDISPTSSSPHSTFHIERCQSQLLRSNDGSPAQHFQSVGLLPSLTKDAAGGLHFPHVGRPRSHSKMFGNASIPILAHSTAALMARVDIEL